MPTSIIRKTLKHLPENQRSSIQRHRKKQLMMEATFQQHLSP